jgi:threonine aldolase
VERLADDHENASRLAEGLQRLGCRLDPPPETNIVYFDPTPVGVSPVELCARLAERGVRMGPLGARVRAVTHLDVSPDDIGVALRAAADALGPSAA